MTDLEMLRKVITDLKSISVPVYLKDQIATPIENASNDLTQLYKAVCDAVEKIKEETEKVKAQASEDDGGIELVVERNEPKDEDVQ